MCSHCKPDDPYYHLRIITKEELRRLVPYCDQHLGRLERAGKFPKRLKLGENRVGWLLCEVETWIGARKAERDRFVDSDADLELEANEPAPSSQPLSQTPTL